MSQKSTENPFGQLLYEGTYKKDTLHIAYTAFDNAVSISITEVRPASPPKTIYSQNYFKWREQAMLAIEDMLVGEMDVEDLVFELKELNDQETQKDG